MRPLHVIDTSRPFRATSIAEASAGAVNSRSPTISARETLGPAALGLEETLVIWRALLVCCCCEDSAFGPQTATRLRRDAAPSLQ
jgi:hypothetical protein